MSEEEQQPQGYPMYMQPIWVPVPLYPPTAYASTSSRIYQPPDSAGVLLTAVPTPAPPSAILNRDGVSLPPAEFSHPLLRKYQPE